MKIFALIAFLAFAGCGQALECYSCKGKKSVDLSSGSSILTSLTALVKDFPECTTFDPAAEEKELKKFTQTCITGTDKSCVKYVDPKNPEDVMRGCSATAKNECDDKGQCFCAGDKCNAAGHGWPSVAVLLSALAVALLASR